MEGRWPTYKLDEPRFETAGQKLLQKSWGSGSNPHTELTSSTKRRWIFDIFFVVCHETKEYRQISRRNGGSYNLGYSGYQSEKLQPVPPEDKIVAEWIFDTIMNGHTLVILKDDEVWDSLNPEGYKDLDEAEEK